MNIKITFVIGVSFYNAVINLIIVKRSYFYSEVVVFMYSQLLNKLLEVQILCLNFLDFRKKYMVFLKCEDIYENLFI